jgi:hypothetical protein
MMKTALATAALAAVVLSPTPAHAGLRSTYQARYDEVAKRHGARAPGRNILKYGMRNGRRASHRQLARSAATLKRMLTVVRRRPPARYAAPVATLSPTRSVATTPTATPVASGGGGGCGGGYRGLYQFDCQTWQSVGGSGDPAAASPAEQTRRAAILRSRRGSSPWPNCGGGSLASIAQCESGGNPSAVG